MAGRRETHRHVADADVLAEHRLLARLAEILAVAHGHDPQGLARGQHLAVAGPGMVGMAVGDESARHRPGRVHVEPAQRTIQPLAGQGQEVARTQAHAGCRTAKGRTWGWRIMRRDIGRSHEPASADVTSEQFGRSPRRPALRLCGGLSSPRAMRRGAAEMAEQALEIAPRYAAAWFLLGRAREARHLATADVAHHHAALRAYGNALDLDPHDELGAPPAPRPDRRGRGFGGDLAGLYPRPVRRLTPRDSSVTSWASCNIAGRNCW